ncbi:PTS sugar transporter subunit IIA [Propionispora hippei]|uniref:PTS system IIA component, Gat family n=1 Tax=Propionispora hippei DSM 15287 TaxID=1123003 RepID=A0A1M6CMY2_9FIRM|nr:PTS sugar transporter subunit IIA [Propionispora hippei]SHI62154.1 PTS system IIA component, Gat family [Propionispora hippei DSM 15287]
MNNEIAEQTGFIGTTLEAKTKEAAISALAGLFLENGFVKDSYPGAVLAREQTFPTGLPTETFGVAIPHTDSVHVIRPGVAIGVLKEPIEFGMMGYPGEAVQVKLLFMLAIKDSNMQIQLLQDLVGLFSEAPLMNQLIVCTESERIVELVQSYLQELKEAINS